MSFISRVYINDRFLMASWNITMTIFEIAFMVWRGAETHRLVTRLAPVRNSGKLEYKYPINGGNFMGLVRSDIILLGFTPIFNNLLLPLND